MHESKAESMLLGSKVDRGEYGAVILRSLPADLPAKTSFVSGGLNVAEHSKKIEEDGFEKVPILRAAGQEAAQPKVRTFCFVNRGAVWEIGRLCRGGGGLSARA